MAGEAWHGTGKRCPPTGMDDLLWHAAWWDPERPKLQLSDIGWNIQLVNSLLTVKNNLNVPPGCQREQPQRVECKEPDRGWLAMLRTGRKSLPTLYMCQFDRQSDKWRDSSQWRRKKIAGIFSLRQKCPCVFWAASAVSLTASKRWAMACKRQSAVHDWGCEVQRKAIYMFYYYKNTTFRASVQC